MSTTRLRPEQQTSDVEMRALLEKAAGRRFPKTFRTVFVLPRSRE